MTDEFPVATLHKTNNESYNILGWQKAAIEHMFYYYLRAFYSLTVCEVILLLLFIYYYPDTL